MDVVAMPNFVPAVELIYRALSQPSPPKPKPAPAKAVAKIELTREDVAAILQRKRGASAEDLQRIISEAKNYGLTEAERNQLCVDLSIQVARARQNQGKRRDDPNARFIAEVLGLVETPFGLIARSFIEDLLRAGSQNIARCRQHRPPLCECWSNVRAMLWQSSASGEKTPEAWAATRINEMLEELEVATRPESG